LWCCIQNQIFVVHGFFNAYNHTTSRYQHIYIFESRHELGFLSNYNCWLGNMLMGSRMSIHQKLECCNLQQYEGLKCNLTSHSSSKFFCCNPTLKKCEDDTHTPEMWTWESFRTPEFSELDCRGQNTSPWGVPYTIGKGLEV
jgi:hypothetical protein